MMGIYKTMAEYLDDSVRGVLRLPFDSTRCAISDFCKYFEDFGATRAVYEAEKEKAIVRFKKNRTAIVDSFMKKTERKYEDSDFYFVNDFLPNMKFADISLVLQEILTVLEFDRRDILNKYFYNFEEVVVKYDTGHKYLKDDMEGWSSVLEISKIVKKPNSKIINICEHLGISVYQYQKNNSNFVNIGYRIKKVDESTVIDFIRENKTFCKNCDAIFIKKSIRDSTCSDECKRILRNKKVFNNIDIEKSKCLPINKVMSLTNNELLLEFGDVEII